MKPSIVYSLKGNLYLNITNKCSNNCYFCFRNLKDGISGFKLKLEKEPSTSEIIQELQKVINKNWGEVVFCGFGEPTARLNEVLEITKWIKKYNKTVRIDTNGHGYLLNPGREVVDELKEAGMDRASVSMNAYNEDLYNQICKPQFENAFEAVKGFVEKSKKVGIDTEITAVTIPEVSMSKMEKLAKELGVKLRPRQYLPLVF